VNSAEDIPSPNPLPEGERAFKGKGGNIFNIPSGVPFAASLAQGVLEETKGDPSALARIRILLPTRRACRTVREAFLQQSNGKPLLLPRLQPLGDVEEEELAIGLAGSDLAHDILTLPPAMPPLRRRILLAQIVAALPGFSSGPEQALALADDLGRLMDQVHTEDLSLSALPGLVAPEHARHWEITTGFLSILSERWPDILAEHGAIDAADRRNRLLRLLAGYWTNNPPDTPVIAAGSIGSIPATGDLLAAVAQLPQGRIVLPGLDTRMDAASWDRLGDTHPQATLKLLLARIGVRREDVKPWRPTTHDSARQILASEMMRPAETSEAWTSLRPFPLSSPARLRGGELEGEGLLASISTPSGPSPLDPPSRKRAGGEFEKAVEGLERIDAETPEEEARAIALILRHTLETPGRTAALVTPDRTLARRVATACRRWGLEVDDSGGMPLQETETGVYLHLVLHAAVHGLRPSGLLALLRHHLCRAGTDHAALKRQTSLLEKILLRGPTPPPGFEGLRNRAERLRAERPEMASRLDRAVQLLDRLEPLLADLLTLASSGEHPAGLWIDRHLNAAEALAGDGAQTGADHVWRGEAGEAAAEFFSSLKEEAAHLPAMDGASYLNMLTQLMAGVTVRPRYGTHPRLAILGTLEARLLQADTVILGSLNERSWPPDPGHDPWLSRPMRAQFGLPSPERMIGLAGHDFVQGFCAGHVVLTRSLRQDNAPTVPARWLQRLDTVLRAAGMEPDTLQNSAAQPWLTIARRMDRAAETRPAPRPAPRPPVSARPRELPVTAIETWLQDPYAIYARYVLNLRKLDPLEKPPDAAARGTFLHDVLNRFVTLYPNQLPPDAERVLIDLGRERFGMLADDSGFWRYWLPRFDRIARWLVRHEAEWRESARPFRTEAKGRLTLPGPAGPFTLTARADRIDRLKAGGMAIIDYKSGGQWGEKAMKDARLPQLPLEAIILDQGGFDGTEEAQTEWLAYWKLTGGMEEGKPTAIAGDDVRVAAEIAANGLLALIEAYDDPATPYLSLPDPERAPAYQDYAQLARVQEWSVAEEAGEAA
jgi:ATP-dependent helicase/nuclease subunit B